MIHFTVQCNFLVQHEYMQIYPFLLPLYFCSTVSILYIYIFSYINKHRLVQVHHYGPSKQKLQAFTRFVGK